MARIPDLRQLKKEDFDSKDQKLIEKLAFPINNFMQQVVNALKNGIDFNNLNQETFIISVSVNSSGAPISLVQFKNGLATKVAGMTCINVINQTSNIRFPTAQPCITWNQNNNILTITNVSGLPIPAGQTNSDTYQLTILTIGSNLPTA